MANTQYIMEQEQAIIDATNTLRSVSESYLYECDNNDGRPFSANRDCWGTLRLNLLTLQCQVAITLSHMGKEFGNGSSRTVAPAAYDDRDQT